ncbi:5'-methylthioadenosine phosphorylase II, partial [mine drainage metagenome]
GSILPRHGKKHTIPPHKVNYRANIWALQKQGVERIISANAVGSLKQEYAPGMMFIPDQFIDFTKRRELTFYDGPDVYHVSSADPFCPEMNEAIGKQSRKLGYDTHVGGTYACIEGPRFSTRAESKMLRQFADIIGMTVVPEINLANELAMCYTSLATITDYDVWAEEPVDTKEVLRILKENEDKSTKYTI